MQWKTLCLHAGHQIRCRPSTSTSTSTTAAAAAIITFSHRSLSTRHEPPQLESSTQQFNGNPTNPSHTQPSYNPKDEASLRSLDHRIETDYARLRAHYTAPRHPIVLAHGLLGFDELHLVPGRLVPGIAYWRGIKEAFRARGIECITTAVPTTASIAERAEALMQQIASKLPPTTTAATTATAMSCQQQSQQQPRDVNIVAHSMGGLDARYMISRLCPTSFRVRSLTTIATPHRGSSAADMLLRDIGPDLLPHMYRLLARLKISSGAFAQLTRTFMDERFNTTVPNHPDVAYFSYGAAAMPHLFSVFRISHDLVQVLEGENDGLVSVRSAKWGTYKGTLMGVTHLDLINWTNRLKVAAGRLGLVEERFNARAFYLDVAEGLAKEGF